MASVTCLPDELLLEVFLYLNVTDIALGIANVCDHWRELARDSLLWNSLKFTVDKDMELSYVLNILPQLPRLRLVSLHWRTDSMAIINELCEHCPSLINIKLICCGYIDQGCVRLIFQRCQNIRELSLSKCWSVPSQCLDDIVLLTNLTALNISNTQLTPQQFASISCSCTLLTSLNIDYVRGIPEDMLAQFIYQRRRVLVSLCVFGDLLTDAIFQNIQLCQRLKRLHISTCSMFSDACFESINKLKSLKSLTMRKSTNLSSRSLWRFYFHSELIQNLTQLYISAKRNVNCEDIDLWSEYYPEVNRNLIHQYCTCILTKNGISFEKSLR